jgi:protein-disulfide isomerase
MMIRAFQLIVAVPLVFGSAACTPSSAQSTDPAALRKEIDALKASQEKMQKDLAEIREFLRAATGGRFGAPRLEDATLDLAGTASKGEASAPLTLVEVSDYHCPFCRRHFQQVQPQIYSAYVDTGKVRHVFLHYPIDQLHPEAFRSHEAAACAGDQGKFWELHGKLFETPARTIDQILAIAGPAGLDVTALKGCLDAGKYSSAVRESVQRMRELGVDSTPMFLIGPTPREGKPFKVEKVVRGAHPFEQFKAAIEPLLNAR